MCVYEGLLSSTHPEKQQAGCWHSQPWMLCVWPCPCVVMTWWVILALNWPQVQSLCFHLGCSVQRVPIHPDGGGMGWCFQPRTMEQAARRSPEDFRASLSCPLSSCPHAATAAPGNSGSVGTCVAPVLHWNSGWWGQGEQVQKHPKASPSSSHRFLSWPWNWFRSF